MKNLFSFLIGAALGAGALTLCALYDEEKVKDKLSNYSKKGSVSNEELDEIIEDTEKNIEKIEQIQNRIDESTSELNSLAEEEPSAKNNHLYILE